MFKVAKWGCLTRVLSSRSVCATTLHVVERDKFRDAAQRPQLSLRDAITAVRSGRIRRDEWKLEPTAPLGRYPPSMYVCMYLHLCTTPRRCDSCQSVSPSVSVANSLSNIQSELLWAPDKYFPRLRNLSDEAHVSR